jgi:hypothetical protein
MRRPGYGRVLTRGLVPVAVLALLQSSPAGAVTTRPTFQMPFACGESWDGSTRSSHSPSPYSIDWNRDGNDLGHVVVATQPGTVASVVDLGGASYGLHIVIDHDDVWSTLYAHLEDAFVVAGQHVDEGQAIALLGQSGNTTGPHLHYEQRRNGDDRHGVFDGVRFVYNSVLQSRDCPDVPLAGSWSGSHRSDVGVFGRKSTSAVFRERSASGSHRSVRFGLPTDQPVVGDWDGNGTSDVGVWRTTKREFVLQVSGHRQVIEFGVRGDVAVTGDWDGDGRTDVGVYNPASATFRLRDADGSVSAKVFGTPGSLPVAGDWDGDGRFEVGVYSPVLSSFRLAMRDQDPKVIPFGTPSSLPVIGYWNKDRHSDIGVWDPATGTFSERLGAQKATAIRFGHLR